MTRFVGAYVWFRWRSLLGSLRFGRARGGLGEVASVAEVLVRALAALAVAVLAIGLAVLAFVAGGRLAGFEAEGVTAVMRFLGGGLVLLAAVIPGSRATEESGGARTRMRLLPVADRELHATEIVAGLLDPWMIVALPAVVLLSVGPARQHGLVAGATALLAGMLFATSLLILATLASRVVQLLLSDRRRIETAAIVSISVIVVISLLPSLVVDEEQLQSWTDASSGAIATVLLWAGPFIPSEPWSAALAAAGAGSPSAALVPILMQLGFVVAGYLLSYRAWSRAMGAPDSTEGRRGARQSGSFAAPFGLPATVAAVAHAQIRTFLRTVRGKLAVALSPVWMVALALLLRDRILERLPDEARTAAIAVATLGGASLAIMGLLPLVANQFAVDRGGLSRQFLTPLTDRAVVAGKAVGGAFLALVSAVPLIVCVAVFLPAPAAVWPGVLCGAMAGYALLAPVAGFVSIVLPRSADLTSLGTAGNAHILAGLLAGAVTGLAVAPAALLAVATLWLGGGPWLYLLTSAGWLVVTALVSRQLLRAVAAMIGGRREALIDVASR